MLKPEDIKLYPMTEDVIGRHTHAEYVDQMASMLVNTMIGYRMDYSEMTKLIQYAKENHSRLNV